MQDYVVETTANLWWLLVKVVLLQNLMWGGSYYILGWKREGMKICHWWRDVVLIGLRWISCYLHCPIYNDLRQVFFNESLKINDHFNSFTDCQKMAFLSLNSDFLRLCANTCNFILKRRYEVLYCKYYLKILLFNIYLCTYMLF